MSSEALIVGDIISGNRWRMLEVLAYCRRPRHFGKPSRRSQDQLVKTLDTKARSTRPRAYTRLQSINPRFHTSERSPSRATPTYSDERL